MDQQETKNLYLLLPAATSGDLWHVAAAQILSSRYAKDDGFNFNIVVAMVCSKNGHGVQGSQKQVEDQENFQKLERKVGSNSFNYFRNIGLPRLLIEVEVAQPSKTNLERTISGLSNKFLDDTYHAQRDLRWSFEDMLNKEELLGKFPSQHKVDETSEPSRILKLMTATTIAMNFLCHQNGSKVDGSRYTYLRQRMCTANINSTEKDVEAEANERYEKLKAVVKQLLEEKVNGQPKYKQVVLENYRTNRTNYQTDSNPTLSNFFREFAEKLQMAVIQIPAVHNTNRLVQLTDPVFDFYGIKDGKAYPGVEARAQCRFWAKVAEDREIAGIFGGRTGSIDVSGFNGMNVFFWDEPWIEWSASSLDLTNAKELGPNNKSGRSTAAKQVPQCLRSLQLLPIMAVGCPTNIRTVKGSDGAPDRTFWDKIQEEQLKEWFSRLGKDPKDRNFELEKAIYPKLPEVKTWRLVSFLRVIPFIGLLDADRIDRLTCLLRGKHR